MQFITRAKNNPVCYYPIEIINKYNKGSMPTWEKQLYLTHLLMPIH